MHDAWLLVSLLVGLPLAALLAVTAGVAATSWYAVRRGRRDPMDPFQERLFLTRRAPALARGAGLAVEGFWQTVAFGLQGVHLVRRIPSPQPVPGGGPPVVLTAGYLENGGQMWLLARRLRLRGYQPVVIDLPSTLRSIESNAEFLAEQVERIRVAADAERVALVGHSMAGVIMRAYVHTEPAAPVACVVSVCSPHRGTHLARLGPGASARDMRVGSAHMRAHPPHRRAGVPVHTLISIQDNIVSPAWSAILTEGENEVLEQPVGHVAPLFLRQVAERIADWLDAADFSAQAPVAQAVGSTGATPR